jgi:hypothetical protein
MNWCSEQVKQIIRTVIEYTFMTIDGGGTSNEEALSRGEMLNQQLEGTSRRTEAE